jgi:hypothetical protein
MLVAPMRASRSASRASASGYCSLQDEGCTGRAAQHGQPGRHATAGCAPLRWLLSKCWSGLAPEELGRPRPAAAAPEEGEAVPGGVKHVLHCLRLERLH